MKRNRNNRGVSTAGQLRCLNDPSLGKPESQDILIPSQQLTSSSHHSSFFSRLFFPVSFSANTLQSPRMYCRRCIDARGRVSLGAFTRKDFASPDHLFIIRSRCTGRPLGASHNVQLVPIKASLAVQEEKSVLTVPLLTPYIGSPSVRALS